MSAPAPLLLTSGERAGHSVRRRHRDGRDPMPYGIRRRLAGQMGVDGGSGTCPPSLPVRFEMKEFLVEMVDGPRAHVLIARSGSAANANGLRHAISRQKFRGESEAGR